MRQKGHFSINCFNFINGKKNSDKNWLMQKIDLERVFPHDLERFCEKIYFEENFIYDGIDWVIVGGESGKNARPMETSWIKPIKNGCRNRGIPFFMKQMSGNTKALREAIPDDLLIREFPE